MIGKWAGRGARGSCVLLNKHRHLNLFKWLERVRESQPQLLGTLVRSWVASTPMSVNCRSSTGTMFDFSYVVVVGIGCSLGL